MKLLQESLAVTLSILPAVMLAAAELPPKPDTSSWVCEFCPFADGHRASIDAGASYVSDSAAAFGDATGYEEKGGYLNLDGSGAITSDDYQARWLLQDLGLDSRRAAFEGGEQGRYEYHVDFQQLPRHRYDTSASIFRQSGADLLSLPSGWVRAPQTGGFSALDSSLQSRDISSERRLFGIGGSYLPAERLRMAFDFRHLEQDGVRLSGASYFTQSSQLPAPFDFTTDEAQLELRYAGAQGFASLTYLSASFQNDQAALRWETPFTSAPGAEIAAMAQAPDNRFQQLSLAGNYHFDTFASVLGFSAASGRVEQDAEFLPYTSNMQLNPAALPRARLDGEVQTSNIALTLTSRPLDKARVRIAYRFDERDNDTPVEQYERVITDTFVSGEIESNLPLSFRKSRFSIGGSYQLWPKLKLSAAYDHSSMDRDYQEVAEQTEQGGWAQLGWRPTSNLDIRVKAGTTERDIDRYDESVAISLGQNPLLRKYNLAYRFREYAELSLAGSLSDKPVSASLVALYANDDYLQSPLGMQQSDDLRIAGDLSFSFAENRYFYVHGGYERIESDQLGSELAGSADWAARNSDQFVMGGAGVNLRNIANKLDLRIDFSRTQGTTEISLNTLASGLSWFPDLESTMDTLRVQLHWQRSEKLALMLGVRWEQFATEDWALQDVAADTIPVVLTLGAEPYDYDILLLGLSFSYRVGQ